jgi:hypothetical protein
VSDVNAFEALEVEEEELFTNPPGGDASSSTTASATVPLADSTLQTDPNGRFLAELASITKFHGRTSATNEQPRKRALVHLIRFAHTKAHLDDFVRAIAGWRDAKRRIDTHTSREIIGRCINLGHPDVAVSLLANRPKFGVDLPSLHVARVLLQSLCERARAAAGSDVLDANPAQPVRSSRLNDVLLLVALYPHYKLPEVYDEPVSLAMVLALCNSEVEEARQVGGELMDAAQRRRTISTPAKMELSAREKEWVHEGRSLVPYPVVWA